MLNYFKTGIIAVVLLMITAPIETYAMTYEEAVKVAYDAFVVEDKDQITVECDDERLRSYNFIYEFESIDDHDNLYDGGMLNARRKANIKIRGNKYTISMNRLFDQQEADELTDRMVEEIQGALPENASESQVFREMSKYIRKTYKYDYAAILGFKDKENFIEAYNGEKKIICSGFATLTYLLANKLGLDCTLYFGTKHMYNGIKFAGDDAYTVIDFASDCPGGLVPILGAPLPCYNGWDGWENKVMYLNSKEPRKFASIMDAIRILLS